MGKKSFDGSRRKALDILLADLKTVDVVLNILDSRAPRSSQNEEFRPCINKPTLVVLNKKELAEEEATSLWLDYIATDDQKAVAIDARTGTGVKNIFVGLETIASKRRTRFTRALRLMVIGIPNVGKSTLVNRLVGKSASKTGNRPGTTRGRQWVRIRSDMELLDTPGLIQPQINDKEKYLCLAALGIIKDNAFDPEEVALWLVSYLSRRYPGSFHKRYKLDAENSTLHPRDIIEYVGKNRGFLGAGGNINYLQASTALIKDFQEGRLGRISLERPGDGDAD